ncbi:MAG: hypothetical protein LBL62_10705 [Planctomycetaceae bacterium]|jgi:hypothetical protein|nr:hypothetical protein [Planctomycetaceae bacterium]
MTNDFPEELYFSTTGRKILKSFIGRKIIRMFRYPLYEESEFPEYLNNLPNGVTNDQVFSLIEGSLLVEFDTGEEINFFADEHMQSIAFSYERNPNGEYMNVCKFYTPRDICNDLYININDTTFSNDIMRDFLNKTIIDIRRYRYRIYPPSPYRIRDTIILFSFDNSTKMALGFNIEFNTVMSVLPWQLVASDVKENISEVDLC